MSNKLPPYQHAPAYRPNAAGPSGPTTLSSTMDFASVQSIPEPATVAMMGVGGAATALAGRRKEEKE
ncbi:MAG: PEP-CTERM sorting domain-containing protein [Sedimentisphaerales bacterium]|nr:PEP-CTERM sorting domain-containing protein [Sedimentisphaerales bacterium]